MKKLLCILFSSLLLTSCASMNGSSDEAMGTTGQLSHHDQGMRYLLGDGVQVNHEQAAAYFEKAATQGNPYAENEIAFMYAAGKGVSQNYETAFHWWQRASEHGLASAQYNLGLMYQHGIGTKRDTQLAQHWFKEAASRGFDPAKRKIG